MMEKILNNLKQELDPYISERNIFTEKDKKKVRVRILEAKFPKKKRVRWTPIFATSIAGLLFIILGYSFVGENFIISSQNLVEPGKNEIHENDSQNGGEIIIEPEPSRIVIDPETVHVGDKINGLVIVRNSGSLAIKKTEPDRNFLIATEGKLTLDGVFRIMPTAEGFENVIFMPDQKSLLKIPIFVGFESDPFIILDSINQELAKYLGLERGGHKPAQITISNYKFYEDSQAGENYHRANLLTVNSQVVPEEMEPVEENVMEYSILKEDLIPLYQDLVSHWEDNKLKGLEPIEVFQLYWQAFEYGNLEIRYFLLGGEGLPEYMVFADKFVEENFTKEQAQFEKIRSSKNLNAIIDGNSAYVIIDESSGERVELVKNDIGVWKMKFLP